MTTEEIAKRIDNINAIAEADDDESAHASEDQLRADFIAYVAALEIPSLAEKARMVLSTDEIKFCRWCA